MKPELSTKEPFAMSLNVKSTEAHKLAAELARLTGESMTKAVTEALRERLERKRRERDRERMVAEAMAIARRVGAYPRRDRRPHGEFLYDERGLPR
jgi:antitoxin VapB